ncbi:unnamed protein product [Schistocephalus solidus]|uniref:PH domain-containing protein n=1 Tax=Schistocephalus solidus TaxID=70667 RepID=A0A183SLW7_SCHSO|nr:unnamed protein product [Schistocephalus solidus]
MAMNDAISVEKAWEEAIMSERKSLEPWMTGHADEHDNLASQSYRSVSFNLAKYCTSVLKIPALGTKADSFSNSQSGEIQPEAL